MKETFVIEAKFDEFVGLDGDAKAEAISRREVVDKKKKEKWEEAKKKTEENKMKREAAKAKKEKEKAKKRGTKKKAKIPMQDQPTSGADMKATLSGFSLTQDRLVHDLTLTTTNLDLVFDIDECILNVSLANLSTDKKAFDKVLYFLNMVISKC